MVKAKLELLSYRLGDLRDPRTFPRCSRATSSRYSVPAGSSRCARYFLLLVTNMGQFPELTPVRSQAIKLWLTTLEAGDITLSLEWTSASTAGWSFKHRVVETFGTGETGSPWLSVG